MGNSKKAEQLGMPFGTAGARLRKMILFDLVKKFGLNVCYRCDGDIETIAEFTIEHKKAWLDVDPALFWDLDNIAFSHMVCNIGAARRYTASVCSKCKINPPSRFNGGYARICTECSTEEKRLWRAKTGRS